MWRETCARAGLEHRYHGLRHHFASVLIAGGCSVKAVQKALGHASASETLDVYSHLWPDGDDLTRRAIDAAWRQSAPDVHQEPATVTQPQVNAYVPGRSASWAGRGATAPGPGG